MEVIWIEFVIASFRIRWDLELAPQGIDVFLGIVESDVFHHLAASLRVGAVCTDEEVGLDADRFEVAAMESSLKYRFVFFEGKGTEVVVELQVDVIHSVELVKKFFV